MNNTRTRTILTSLVLMFIAATLVVAVGTFAATTTTTTQAQSESESSSTTCISDQPCQSTVSNSTQSLSQDEFADNKD